MKAPVNPWRKRLVAAGFISPIVSLWVVIDNHERRELALAEVRSSQTVIERLATGRRETHMSNLSFYGATVIRSMLNDEEIQIWKQRTRKSFGDAVNVNGRFHFHVARSSLYHEDLAKLGGENWVKGRLQENKRDDKTGLTEVVDDYFRREGVARYSLTQLQLLNVIPGSTHQIWHKDNTKPGLTALIALRDVGTNGPTELLLRSHNSSLSDCLRNELKLRQAGEDDEYCQHLMGCLREGDAILYDSRLLHRGRGYNIAQMDRPVLVLRWDASLTPPPGSGLVMTTVTRFMGSWLSTVVYMKSKAYDALFGSQ